MDGYEKLYSTATKALNSQIEINTNLHEEIEMWIEKAKGLEAENDRLKIDNEQQQNLIESLQYDIEQMKQANEA